MEKFPQNPFLSIVETAKNKGKRAVAGAAMLIAGSGAPGCYSEISGGCQLPVRAKSESEVAAMCDEIGAESGFVCTDQTNTKKGGQGLRLEGFSCKRPEEVRKFFAADPEGDAHCGLAEEVHCDIEPE